MRRCREIVTTQSKEKNMTEAYMVFRKVEDFAASWENESGGTRKILEALTDVSLKHGIAKGHRDIGRVAWHIVCTIAEMANRTGLKVDGPSDKEPVPASVVEIQKAYDKAAGMLLEQVKRYWKDETLTQIDDMYGEKWQRGLTLGILVSHEVHHRGQLTVLMRSAGLPVPGVYGPSLEEWKNYGANPPEV
jgi:uncharacterized damage-inducible protein DinB